MQNKTAEAKDTLFEQEVHEGLSSYPKHLSSKYFYDVVGDQLFQKIMALPEYYLTNCEYSILQEQKAAIGNYFIGNGSPFSLFELGAGDGKKTKVLLAHLLAFGANFDYRPIDISQNALDLLEQSITMELPKVNIQSLQGTYFDTLKAIGKENKRRKIILFLGSNIGNLLHDQAIIFLKELRAVMQEGDLAFIGFDQKKDPQVVLDAYNDPTGVTAAFNKNILTRINHEMDGDFALDNFKHWEVYDPETGTAKSYLIAKKKHQVRIEKLDLTVNFEAWESIHTEISQKYDDKVVVWLAKEAGLKIVTQFSDAKDYYKNYILKK